MMYNIIKSNIKYDVIVCGCGSAGFCAAIAAARNGAKTALIEKYSVPGGILTVLGNNSIDQFNNPFKKNKKMIIAGIGWEFVMRLYRDGFAIIPDMNAEYKVHYQYGVKVNPVAAAKVMDDMLIEAGVDLYYGQPIVDVVTDQKSVKSVLISTKDGIKSIEASAFIDCTGDGDVAHYANATTDDGDGNGVFQPGAIVPIPEEADNGGAERIIHDAVQLSVHEIPPMDAPGYLVGGILPHLAHEQGIGANFPNAFFQQHQKFVGQFVCHIQAEAVAAGLQPVGHHGILPGDDVFHKGGVHLVHGGKSAEIPPGVVGIRPLMELVPAKIGGILRAIGTVAAKAALFVEIQAVGAGVGIDPV